VLASYYDFGVAIEISEDGENKLRTYVVFGLYCRKVRFPVETVLPLIDNFIYILNSEYSSVLKTFIGK
jgi:hypothetical protein